MFDASTFFLASSYIGAGLAIGFGAIGAALGQGYTAGMTTEALSRRPEKAGDVIKNMLVGQAIAESAAIFALVVAVILLFGRPAAAASMLSSWGAVGAGFAMGLAAIGSGFGAGLPGGAACVGTVRQPANSGRIMTTMLIGSAVSQTPAIFGMVMAFLLIFGDFSNIPLYLGWAAILGAGLSTGLSAIGSGLGSGLPGRSACEGVARNPENGGKIMTTMLVGSALCQTPAIFGIIVAFMLLFADFSGLPQHLGWAALLGAGLATGFSAIGSGFGTGLPGGAACDGMARQPENGSKIMTTMLVGSALCQTPAIFGMVIAFMLLFADFSGLPQHLGWAVLLGAALSTGLAAIGPGIGNGITSKEGVEGVARYPETQTNTTRAMLVGMSVSQSTVIYGFLISLMLLYYRIEGEVSLSASLRLLAAGLCMGFGGIGPGIGQGITAAYAVKRIAMRAKDTTTLFRTMLVGMAVAESTGIYSLIVAILLIAVI